MFEVKLQQFSGPLQLLLELIEQQELPIEEVSLASVTDAYLSYLDSHAVPTEELADFLMIATRLLYLKSKAILPVQEEEEETDAEALADQLRLYKRFVVVAAKVEELFLDERHAFIREKTVMTTEPSFVPPVGLKTADLWEVFQHLSRRLQPFATLRQASFQRVVSVKIRLKQLRDLLMERTSLSFGEIIRSSESKVDTVVSFLALLELLKHQTAKATQNRAFDDIIITHHS